MNLNTHKFNIWESKTQKRTQQEISAVALTTMEMVKKAMNYSRQMAISFAGETNPQMVEMRIRKEAEAQAFESVLRSLRGDTVDIRIFAGV